MTRTKLTCLLAFGMVSTLTATTTWAGPPDSQWHSKWAAPFTPQDTIYRPECWLTDESLRRCGDDRSGP